MSRRSREVWRGEPRSRQAGSGEAVKALRGRAGSDAARRGMAVKAGRCLVWHGAARSGPAGRGSAVKVTHGMVCRVLARRSRRGVAPLGRARCGKAVGAW
jgi:hypothetical protein